MEVGKIIACTISGSPAFLRVLKYCTTPRGTRARRVGGCLRVYMYICYYIIITRVGGTGKT